MYRKQPGAAGACVFPRKLVFVPSSTLYFHEIRKKKHYVKCLKAPAVRREKIKKKKTLCAIENVISF